MYKWVFKVVAVGFCVLSLTACSKAPGEVAEAFVEEIVAGDAEGAMDLSTVESHMLIGLMDLTAVNPFPKGMDVEVAEEVIDGDKAMVRLLDKKSGKKQRFRLYKRDGEWKVHFNKY